MNLDVGVGGRITYPGMTQWIQYKLGKQFLRKKCYTTLGIEPRTYSFLWRSRSSPLLHVSGIFIDTKSTVSKIYRYPKPFEIGTHLFVK